MLTIIIVNHNVKADTTECVESITSTTEGLDCEIIIVDNSTREEERVNINNNSIRTYHIPNEGYSQANNYGMKRAAGDYILLLNPDTIAKDNAISDCLAHIKQNPDIGALGCRLIRPDGTLDHACRRGFPTPFTSLCYYLKLHKLFPRNSKICRYTFSHMDSKGCYEVDSLSGAFMLMPAEVVKHLGYFDEDYFMYGEDIDLCYRIKQAGYKVFYFGKREIVHKKYKSGLGQASVLATRHFYKSMLIFYDKHYKDKYNAIVTALVHSVVNIMSAIKLAMLSAKK